MQRRNPLLTIRLIAIVSMVVVLLGVFAADGILRLFLLVLGIVLVLIALVVGLAMAGERRQRARMRSDLGTTWVETYGLSSPPPDTLGLLEEHRIWLVPPTGLVGLTPDRWVWHSGSARNHPMDLVVERSNVRSVSWKTGELATAVRPVLVMELVEPLRGCGALEWIAGSQDAERIFAEGPWGSG